MSNHNLVCLPCRLFYRAKKTGINIEEGRPVGDGTWAPYKLFKADLYACPGCGHEVVSGFGRGPIAEHYEPQYRAMVEMFPPIARVDDC